VKDALPTQRLRAKGLHMQLECDRQTDSPTTSPHMKAFGVTLNCISEGQVRTAVRSSRSDECWTWKRDVLPVTGRCDRVCDFPFTKGFCQEVKTAEIEHLRP
jgi:hypothetical protein